MTYPDIFLLSFVTFLDMTYDIDWAFFVCFRMRGEEEREVETVGTCEYVCYFKLVKSQELSP